MGSCNKLKGKKDSLKVFLGNAYILNVLFFDQFFSLYSAVHFNLVVGDTNMKGFMFVRQNKVKLK